MADPTPRYDTDIKPLFRDRDRGAMMSHFDLWSYEDVVANADAILDAVSTGYMPCDRQWPEDEVDKLRSWVQGGKPE